MGVSPGEKIALVTQNRRFAKINSRKNLVPHGIHGEQNSQSRSDTLPCKGKTILHLIFSIGSMYELGVACEYRAYFSAAQRARVFFGGTSASIHFSVEEPSKNIE